MPHIHWVARQNKLEIPRDKDEVKQREIRESDGRAHDPDTPDVGRSVQDTVPELWGQFGKKWFSFLQPASSTVFVLLYQEKTVKRNPVPSTVTDYGSQF
jgi:hypothetical protein